MSARTQALASLSSLGLLTQAAHKPEHWDSVCRAMDANDPAVLGAMAECELVTISASTPGINDAYAITDELRALRTRVVMRGGLHVSAMPDDALTDTDAIAVGKGLLHVGPCLSRRRQRSRPRC